MADKDEVKKEDAEAAKPAPFVPGPVTITLRKPVKAHGDEVSELKFREPTGGDIEQVGNPVNLDVFSDPVKLSFDGKKMTAMMSLLAAVPPSTIRAMDTKDWNNAAWQLVPFFTPDL